MKDIVIIPTYFRPEYLTLCLEHIQAARGNRELDIRVYHDARRVNVFHAGETEEVCKSIGGMSLTIREPHLSIGNTLNFLEAYKDAYNSGARYVYLIEDDVLVGRDFFTWHEVMQSKRDYFCSVGWHDIRNPEFRRSDDPLAVVESSVDFSSIGVCWKRENLAEIVRHAVPLYYQSPGDYLAIAFPGSPIPHNRWVEQAGLIMRVLLDGRGRRVVAWAARPRCAHIGVSGYHRAKGHQFKGSLEARIAEIRACVESGELAKMATEFDDINLLGPEEEWRPEDLYVCQRF